MAEAVSPEELARARDKRLELVVKKHRGSAARRDTFVNYDRRRDWLTSVPGIGRTRRWPQGRCSAIAWKAFLVHSRSLGPSASAVCGRVRWNTPAATRFSRA